MIKMVFCARRHPSLSPEKFLDDWLTRHSPLFQKHARDFRAAVSSEAVQKLRSRP